MNSLLKKAAVSLGVGALLSFLVVLADMGELIQGTLVELLMLPGNTVVRAVWGGFHSFESILLGLTADARVYGCLWFYRMALG